MSMSASTILDIIAPQYKSDPDKASFISLARGQTKSCFYGSNYEKAVALRAAHDMAMRDKGESGGTGEIASKREGDLAIAFHKADTMNGGDSDLASTPYGIQLLGLRAGSGPFMGVTGGCDNGCI